MRTVWRLIKTFFALAGAIQTLLWLGGSFVLTAAAAIGLRFADLPGWQLALFLLGTFLLSCGALAATLANLPPTWYIVRKVVEADAAAQAAAPAAAPPPEEAQQQPRRRAPTPPAIQALLVGMSPANQLSSLIEEGQQLRASLPNKIDSEAENVGAQRLVRVMLGWDVDYPARVYEWETRVWRTITTTPALNQYRALFTYQRGKAQPFARLHEHMDARIEELRTILARV